MVDPAGSVIRHKTGVIRKPAISDKSNDLLHHWATKGVQRLGPQKWSLGPKVQGPEFGYIGQVDSRVAKRGQMGARAGPTI